MRQGPERQVRGGPHPGQESHTQVPGQGKAMAEGAHPLLRRLGEGTGKDGSDQDSVRMHHSMARRILKSMREDVIGGIAVAKDGDYAGELKFGYMCEFGGVMSPFTGCLLLRGLKTLAIRMREHERNALAVARYLEQHPRVKRVYYPGLPSSPGYETAKAQMSGFGGMASFDIDGTLAQSKQVVNSMKLFKLAVSLGDCESLVQHPFAMTHRGYTEEEIAAAGLTPSMVRLSVGLEDQDEASLKSPGTRNSIQQRCGLYKSHDTPI
ncbi:MAG TPA: hypothetical protein DDZ84_05180 [Firmicutes bacterium]|nr:hypothetical protein [Bacillota bacterium]